MRAFIWSLVIAFPLLGWASPQAPDSTSLPNVPEQASSADGTHLPQVASITPVVGRAPQKKAPKVHNWTGSLVDAVCMADVLRQVPAPGDMLYPDPLTDYYSHLQAEERSQLTPQGGDSATPSTQTQSQPRQPNPATDANADPHLSERELAYQAAQLKRANLLRHQIQVCAPHKPTSHYGLVVSNGYLLKFNSEGDFKALRALKESDIQAGRTVKAKVTGVITSDENTVEVASIEIKGQIPPSQATFDLSFEPMPSTY